MDFGATRIRAALVVAVVATLLVLPPPGRRLIATGGFNGDDEARYPLMAREMLVRGVWFDLHVRGERTWEKPPLLPWMIAAFARIRGSVTEATAQLPVGLATIVTVIATCLLADVLFPRRAGLWAALILITSYDVFANSPAGASRHAGRRVCDARGLVLLAGGERTIPWPVGLGGILWSGRPRRLCQGPAGAGGAAIGGDLALDRAWGGRDGQTLVAAGWDWALRADHLGVAWAVIRWSW